MNLHQKLNFITKKECIFFYIYFLSQIFVTNFDYRMFKKIKFWKFLWQIQFFPFFFLLFYYDKFFIFSRVLWQIDFRLLRAYFYFWTVIPLVNSGRHPVFCSTILKFWMTFGLTKHIIEFKQLCIFLLIPIWSIFFFNSWNDLDVLNIKALKNGISFKIKTKIITCHCFPDYKTLTLHISIWFKTPM